MKNAPSNKLTPAEAARLKEFTRLAKAIGFPRGKDTTDLTAGGVYSRPRCKVSWYRRGGHGGRNTITRVLERAKESGFEMVNSDPHATPDGSTVGRRSEYVKKDDKGNVVATLHWSSSYGVVAAENRFILDLTGVEFERGDD